MASGITPYLLYEDGAAACEFLARAFGFEEVLRSHSPEGRVWHAELRLGDSVLYLGEPAHGYVSPRRAGGTTVSLDHLGPMVVNVDGTMSRIANWDKMAEIEKKNTLRIIGKRNKDRLAALKAAAAQNEGEAK